MKPKAHGGHSVDGRNDHSENEKRAANYQLGRQKANSISEMTRACEFALWEEVSSGFSARAQNSEGWGLRRVLGDPRSG